MKAFKLIGFALLALIMATNFASCSNNDDFILDEPKEEKYITVGLGCSGELLEVTNSPLGRSTEDDLYGIQVYTIVEEAGSSYNNYAYGVFSSLENITIKLLEGQKYKFAVTILVNGVSKGFNFYNNYDGGEVEAGSQFEYSETFGLDVTQLSYSMVDAELLDFHYEFDRYYGEVEYTANEEEQINIATKRTSYGVNFIAENLTEGTLKIEVKDRYTVELTEDKPSYESIYTYSNIYAAWLGNAIWNDESEDYEYETYTSEKKLILTWIKDDGSNLPMGTYNISFKRNVKNTIKIYVADITESKGIAVTKIETSWDHEKEFEIKDGEVLEVDQNN